MRRAISSGRKASCARARFARWLDGPVSRVGSRCWTCAAGSPGPDGSSRTNWVAPIWAWTPARVPSRSPAIARRSPVPLRGVAGSLRCPPDRSTWCSCSRPCSPFRISPRCFAGCRGALEVRRAVRVHHGGGPAPYRRRGPRHAGRRHGVAHAARRDAHLLDARRAGRPLAGRLHGRTAPWRTR